MNVEFLGAVPLDPRIGKSADYGVSFLDEYPDSPASIAYLDIIDSKLFPDKSVQLVLIPALQKSKKSLVTHNIADILYYYYHGRVALAYVSSRSNV